MGQMYNSVWLKLIKCKSNELVEDSDILFGPIF